MLRAAVIGARCRRQGIGAHLARFLGKAGAEVVAVAGTSLATAEQAARALAPSLAAPPRPWDDVDRMLAAERLDVVVVASPHETHERYARAALDRGLHVLCEKPLCWGGADPVAAAEDLARRFVARGRHLVVNTQWPWTLATFRALHPRALDRTPRRFRMRLSPRSSGAAMVPDALPHALSLLAAVRPGDDARVEDVRVERDGDEAWDVRFAYAADGARIDAHVTLRTAPEPPRAASYAFDDAEVRRVVELPGYSMSFEADGRRVALPDPTPRVVEDFLLRVSSGAAPRIDGAAVPGMRLLGTIWEASDTA